jgi:inner membrane protein
MDNVTHTLFGATLARTPLGRAGRGATAALILASNAPDIDIVTTMGGAASYLKWHRGPTHGPIGIVGLGIVTAALVWGAIRLWQSFKGRRQEDTSQEGVRFAALATVSIAGVLFHVLMDLPTSYGTRLFSPFDWHWYAADIMPIIDIYLWAILGACLFFGRKATLKGSPYVGGASLSGSRWDPAYRNAAIALVLMALNYGIRIASHQQALAAVPRVFGPTLPPRCVNAVSGGSLLDRWPPQLVSLAQAEREGPALDRCLIEVAATPSFTSPFEWRLVAHLSNAYETRDVSVIDARWRRQPADSEALWRLVRHYPNVWTPAVQIAAATPVAQVFLGFARFPQARAVTDRQGVTTVRLGDMRFTGPGPRRREPEEPPNIFTVIVRVGPGGEIIDQKLGS